MSFSTSLSCYPLLPSFFSSLHTASTFQYIAYLRSSLIASPCLRLSSLHVPSSSGYSSLSVSLSNHLFTDFFSSLSTASVLPYVTLFTLLLITFDWPIWPLFTRLRGQDISLFFYSLSNHHFTSSLFALCFASLSTSLFTVHPIFLTPFDLA